MTSVSIRRLQYVSGYNSYRQISEETGIPVSTLSYVNRGMRDLPEQYVSSLRNFYQREAYSQLKESGMSTSQANRFRWYTPEKVLETQEQMSTTVLSLTLGAVAAKLKSSAEKIVMEDILDLWNEMEQSILDGLRNSPKNFEDWLDYGSF